ncbi:MAG: DsbA family oxidoreductase [Solirubrobacteraceae bacterium]
MRVEIWSDVACPWCYIGKRRFEAALARFEHADDVEVVWRSFELDPGAPAERKGELVALLARKYGMTLEQAHAAQQNLTDTAAGEGLELHFDRVRSGNTFDAHRLIHLAATHGLRDATKERLLAAYFGEGKLMSDHETLVALALEAGLRDEQEVRRTLADAAFADEVRSDENDAAELGIGGVPTFIVDRRVGVTGAQPAEVMLELLRQGWARREPVLADGAAGESCGVDGC